MVNAFLSDLPDSSADWISSYLPVADWLIANGIYGSIPIVTLLFLFTSGARSLRFTMADKVSAGLVAVASYIITRLS